ncbi:hypothetical protein GQ53DRAFT_838125 [Thozetella sp. PMI_491]|nr:hypothetical protein GQ53DRAFT_838125 [Thozetella sp. PMI_491]
MAVSVSATTLPLEGLSLAIFVVAVVCCVLSSITVALRILVRFQDRVIGWDDKFMAFGAVAFIVECGLGAWAAQVGLGRRNADLNEYLMVQSIKYLMIWMLMYIFCLVVVKTSICLTMSRICGPQKVYRWVVHGLLALVVANFITTMVGVLLLCQPVEANWDTSLVLSGKAKCASMSAMIGLSYTSTAVSIATDLAIAVLPGFIIWNTQMPVRTKVSVYVLLGVGSLASVSTIIRTPYIEYYRNPTNDLAYHIGGIPLWSMIETTIGLVTGSLPALRRLITRSKSGSNTKASSAGHKNSGNQPNSLVTFGSLPARGTNFRNTNDIGTLATVHARGDGDWQRLHDSDNSSQDKILPAAGIRKDESFTVSVEMDPMGDNSKARKN